MFQYRAAARSTGAHPPYLCILSVILLSVPVLVTTACNQSLQAGATSPATRAVTAPDNRLHIAPIDPPSQIRIEVTPSQATLGSGSTMQFAATVRESGDPTVRWSVSSGAISQTGMFTAPKVSSPQVVRVVATSAVDPLARAAASIAISPAVSTALAITADSLPGATAAAPYDASLAATGGALPYSWSIVSGSLPGGLQLNAATGEISGTASQSGVFAFTAQVTDSLHAFNSAAFAISIAPSANPAGSFDGPAELPRVYLLSSLADTPAPGTTISVGTGGDLQGALNAANCGDTITLEAGASFSGQFRIPAKACDAQHWIIVRTSAPDSALPAEGQRATPCYAGVSSLVGRPPYSCPNPQNVLARVQMEKTGNGPFQFATGANYYRFIGLEVTRSSGIPGPADLFSISGKGGTADHIVLDRSWLHGGAQDETNVGVNVNGMTSVAVVDSYFSDFHCIARSGSCTDAHAVTGGTGDLPEGPFKIQDNFLEASGEEVMFGGGEAISTPTDITITGNHFWKPWQWMPGNHPFVGGKDGNPFIVKNHVELKNAVRVLIEANLMENSWGGFSQTGYGILLTPKNQHTLKGTNVCPVCQVTDVTIRYVHISHAGGGIQMATSISGNGSGGAAALAGTRWSIHDVVLDDLSKNYAGPGTAFEIANTWPTNALNTVTINHVTAFPDSTTHLIIMGNKISTAPMYGLVFTNNLTVTGQYPVWNSGGGEENCAFSDVPITSISNCFKSYTFANNALIAAPAQFGPSSWPANNMFPPTANDVQFANYNSGNGGNYELQPSSEYKNAGSDGKDLGADIVGLNAMLANVE